MKFRLFALLALVFSSLHTFSQQLVINEISQGTASKEYVELVVIGSPTCATPVPCLDLRGMVIDDNDGYFSSSASGSGVAAGAVRFANISFWSCIPQGTIIVIYNNTDVNLALPANDVSMNDGNCRLIIPVNSSLLEGQSVSPSTSLPSIYPSSGWVVGGGNWSQVAMSNSNDSYQIRNSISSVAPSFGVSWGNNTVNNQIYFPSATGAVFSMLNTASNNPAIQGNWAAGAVGTDETPGVGNNTANSLWIASMNPQCAVGVPTLQVDLTVTAESCPGACDGAINSVVTNGAVPYVYSWSNSASSANLSNLCPGTYVVQVTDNNGCTQNASAVVQAGVAGGNAAILPAGPFDVATAPYQLIPVTSGGTWSSACGSCLTSTGVFSPSLSGVGTFQVCYTVGVGPCASTECINILVTSCPAQNTQENISLCPGDSLNVFGQIISSAGSFSHLFSSINGCDSTHTVLVQLYPTYPSSISQTLCAGDSIFVFGNWVFEDFAGEQQETDMNGCSVKNQATILFENCFYEEFELFVPNVFTPNNDGVNDLFKIELIGGYLNSGRIINRWGEVIVNFDDNNRTWNGRARNGSLVSDGVYTYVLKYTPNGKFEESVQGFVTVVR